MVKYTIFGGSGFVGTNLYHELKRFSNEVRIIDRRNTEKPIDILSTNKEDKDYCKESVEWADVVFHLAALPAHRLSMSTPLEVIHNNYNTTLQIVEWCRKYNKKLIYASSFSIYGNTTPAWKEDSPYGDGETPYSNAKIACELLLKTYSTIYNMDIMVARFSNVYGPFEELHEPRQVLPIWMDLVKRGQTITVYGRETTRDFTYVFDVVQGLLLLSKLNGFDIYNICSGVERKLVDVARKLTLNVIVQPLPRHEAIRWVGDNSKLKSLGWNTTTNLSEWLYAEKLRGKF